MVFESIVVDVLNRFLGAYVENLNRSQLKLGIWGGDVVLENLVLKQNALEELNIPVQTVYGHLGKLVLKIPWKNLYGASVEATVERLLLIVTPSAEVKYDAEKEEKMALSSKQAELLRVEEAKKQEAQKDENKLDETFVEKLVTQIIKNVQLKIKDIHVRYEDSITNPKAPFSFGITLHNLSVHTTDENWKQTVIQEAVTKIFKILNLEGLAVYWNPAAELYAKMDSTDIRNKLIKEIATKSAKPEYYSYALGPINATAKLKLNPKPEADVPKFSIPKVILSLHMEQLSVSLTKAQYRDMMLLADSMDQMNRAAPYRKYRPDLKSYRGYYKEWWKFAFTCILEEEVKRRRRNWDWTHMLNHRNLCKEYANVYQCKLTSKGKVSPNQQCILDKGERHLDLLNLVVIRQRIELEVEKLGKLEAEAKKSRGWFGSWWGSGTPKDDELAEGTAIMKQFEKAMTPEEKAKLFRAIDYQENSAPLHLPAEYIAVDTNFRLDRLQVTLDDKTELLRASVDCVSVSLGQRPGASALRVDVQMQAFTVTGVQQGEFLPQLVTSENLDVNANLLHVIFETNPLDGTCGQRVKLTARPLQIVYDAQTVIEIVDVFKPPVESTALTALQAVAENKLSDLKEKSALGMQYAVQQHTFIDIDVDIPASYIIIPHSGKYQRQESCVVVKLGAISIKSAPRSGRALDVHALYRDGRAGDDILREISAHSYDVLALKLSQMQIVIATSEENWREAIASDEATPLHLLQPTNLLIQIHKCLITDDPRLPKIKVRGELQKIAISACEDRLLTLFEILVSMPLPKSPESTPLKASDSKASSLSLLKYLDPTEKQKRDTVRANKRTDEHAPQMTEVEAFFIMNEFTLSVNRKSESDVYDRMLVFSLNLLELVATQKTYTLEVMVKLGAVSLNHHRPGFDVIHMIHTPDIVDSEVNQYLFVVTYVNVDKKCPDFRGLHGSVEQLIELDFTTLSILLHLEGLQQILLIANEYQTRLNNIQGSVDRIADAGKLETIMEDDELEAGKSKTSLAKRASRRQVESIQLKVNAKMGAVELMFATNSRPLSNVQIRGLTAGLVLKHSYTQVDCTLATILVEDLNPNTIHKEILKVLGGDVITVQIVLYNLEQYPKVSDTNISIDAQINCMRIMFLNWYVTSMLEFLNNFQTAQQAIIEASSQAADAARANVQNAYENSTKVLLKVRLAAPIIVIPENSTSQNAVLIDLGRMNMSNKFVDFSVADASNKVTIDELTLDLEEVQVSCVYLQQESQVQERLLLRPTSFRLLVRRSLSGWYRQLPDLDVSGRMHTIAITVGHSDYKSIMKILNQNLQEGRKEEPKPPPASRAISRPAIKSQASKSHTRTVVAETHKQEDLTKPRTTIKFAFTMDSFVIDLMTPATNLSALDVQNTDSSPKDVGLARFCLALLSVKGRMHSDNSMHTSVLLVDCTLDDTRPARGDKITRYLERRRESSEEPETSVIEVTDKVRSMIDITYTMKNNDTFIDMRIFSFNLILAMDFLNKIAEFMTTGLVDSSNAKEVEEIKVVRQTSEKIDRKRSTAQPPVEPPKPAMMTVNIKIEKPDIFLVESLEQKNCQALVLNMEARLKLRQDSTRMVADGGISGLCVAVRPLGGAPSSPPAPRYLLAPTDLSVALARPEGHGLHVDVALQHLALSAAPDIIGLLSRALTTMTRREEDEVEVDDKPIVYHQLWDIQPFKPNSYWFLKTDKAEEATEAFSPETTEVSPAPPSGEICLLSCPAISLSLETEVGSDTIPVLVMQASFNAQVKNWSSNLHVDSTWAMQMSYYNIGRAIWEPLVEPVEVLKDSNYMHVPWELKMEVTMRTPESITVDTSDESVNARNLATRLPKTSILVSSADTLDLTLTSTGIQLLTQLGNSFSAAIADTPVTSKSRAENVTPSYNEAPYVLHNCTGLSAKLMLQDNEDFDVFNKDGNYKEVVVEHNACLSLQLKRAGLNMIKLNEAPPQLKLKVKIVELDETIEIPVERADKRYFPLGRRGSQDRTVTSPDSTRGLISEVLMQDGAWQIYLRSVVQVTNKLSVDVCVYYMTESGNEVRLLATVPPDGVLRLPLQAVHTQTNEIFFSVEGFTVSVSPFIWRELQQEVKIAKLLHCDSKDKNCEEKFYIKVLGSMEQVFLENTNRHTFLSSCFSLVLQPAVTLHNCLPVPLTLSQRGHKRTHSLRPGEMLHLPHLQPHQATVVVLIPSYLDKCWVCTRSLPESCGDPLVAWTFESHDSAALATMELGVRSDTDGGLQHLSLYCPFWMLNKTGLTLCYRKSKKPEKDSNTSNKIKNSNCCSKLFRNSSSDVNQDESNNVIFHPPDYKDPILFSFRAKNFFGKKKAAIRVDFGEWSDKFSLDVPGSSGVVICKSEGRTYQVAVTNQLTFNSLTKMVVFTPFFLIINEAPFPIQYQEMHRPGDPWQEVNQKSCSPLWPVVDREEKLLRVRVSGFSEYTAPFVYTEQHTTTLKLDNEYGGLRVETQLSEGGTYITIRQYRDGHAPALLVNCSRNHVCFVEKDNVNVRTLPSMHRMLYTWENPIGSRTLVFKGYKNKEEENDLRKDEVGEFMINESVRIYWVSFLDGLQRVVLFTDDVIMADGVRTLGTEEQVDTEFVLSIQGFGLSLVNDLQHLEILYMSISNSGIIWEQCKIGGQRYKKIDDTKSVLLEEAYQRFLNEKIVSEGAVPSRVEIDDKTEVDFEIMHQYRPTPRILRRRLEAGVWACAALSPHTRRIHARLHRPQLDQMLPHHTFPVLLAPVPPPRTVAGPDMKPFIEVSIVERIMEHSSVRQYKYYKILVQEFHVKVDMGLINALMGMFPPRTLDRDEALEAFLGDLERARQPLEQLAAQEAAMDQKNFYDNLHLSPIKVHVSFSLGGATELPTFVGTVLQGIGVTLTDMNDVVFKLSYYERNYEFLSQKELMNQVQSHYTGQALKQLYVLVLGLDVIGNPYGLVVGLKKGVEDLFYEPFQGAIQGPGEFAEGLVLGVRSLVGHTVGGAAGAVSRITGAMGHGLAALSLDADYQRRRRDRHARPPTSLHQGLARSGRGLLSGVVGGVTGVFTKPLEGAREEGAAGFFKGLGKGAVGLVARPTAGVVDFASGSFDAVKRAADMSEEVSRRRCPRYLPPDCGVRPYSRRHAEGYRMLAELDKGKYLSTDTYEAHVWVRPAREVVLCTDKRLLYLDKNHVFGGWQILWSYFWSELPEVPTITHKGVHIPIGKKKVFGMFSNNTSGKLILLVDEQQKKYFVAQCERLIQAAR